MKLVRAALLLCCLGVGSCASDLDVQLADAVSRDDVERVRQLVSEGADANGMIHDGWTPFVIAARDGKIGSVQVFLEMRVNPNIPMKGSNTPISWAAYNGHKDVVVMLLKHEADPCARDDGGMTAKVAAMKYQHLDIAKLLPGCL